MATSWTCGKHFRLEYKQTEIADLDRHRTALEEEIADRLEGRPWSDLEKRYDLAGLAELTAGLPPVEISAAGLLDRVVRSTRYNDLTNEY